MLVWYLLVNLLEAHWLPVFRDTWQRVWLYRFAFFQITHIEASDGMQVTDAWEAFLPCSCQLCISLSLGLWRIGCSQAYSGWVNHLHKNLRSFHLVSIFLTTGQKWCSGLLHWIFWSSQCSPYTLPWWHGAPGKRQLWFLSDHSYAEVCVNCSVMSDSLRPHGL